MNREPHLTNIDPAATPWRRAGQRVVRWLRHRWADLYPARLQIPQDLLVRLAERVADSETRHTGEIRVHIETGLPWSYIRRDASARARAVRLFGKLGIWDTADNNGVLIYVLLADHAIEVVADRGLCARVVQAHWNHLVADLSRAFRDGQFEPGLNQAVDAVTAMLVQAFPIAADHDSNGGPSNQLRDAPTTGWQD